MIGRKTACSTFKKSLSKSKNHVGITSMTSGEKYNKPRTLFKVKYTLMVFLGHKVFRICFTSSGPNILVLHIINQSSRL